VTAQLSIKQRGRYAVRRNDLSVAGGELMKVRIGAAALLAFLAL